MTQALRGLLSLTPQRLSVLSSVKKNQLLRYEDGKKPLSKRDKNWLVSTFRAAGVDIFISQGYLQVTFDGLAVIVNGQMSVELARLKKGDTFRQKRHEFGLSQKAMARESLIPQHIISAIENNKKQKYHLSQLLSGNRFLFKN